VEGLFTLGAGFCLLSAGAEFERASAPGLEIRLRNCSINSYKDDPSCKVQRKLKLLSHSSPCPLCLCGKPLVSESIAAGLPWNLPVRSWKWELISAGAPSLRPILS
jgi:hypothetical protein